MKNSKRLIWLAVIAAMCLLPAACASAPQTNDQQYDSEKDFEVKREGDGVVITKYKGRKKEVRIPPNIQNLPVIGITNSGEKFYPRGAFADRKRITSVTIPNSVTIIGDNAFSYCTRLASITIPDSVTTIGNDAFAGCESLASVTIPNSVTSIGDQAFRICSRLTSITIPDSVTSIGVATFSYCFSLTSVTIGSGVRSIGEGVFMDCHRLTSITLDDRNTAFSIIDGALYDKRTNSRVDNSRVDLLAIALQRRKELYAYEEQKREEREQEQLQQQDETLAIILGVVGAVAEGVAQAQQIQSGGGGGSSSGGGDGQSQAGTSSGSPSGGGGSIAGNPALAQRTYANYARAAREAYDNIINARRSGEPSSRISQLENALKNTQSQMRDYRIRAQQQGVPISQDEYETKQPPR